MDDLDTALLQVIERRSISEDEMMNLVRKRLRALEADGRLEMRVETGPKRIYTTTGVQSSPSSG